MCFLSWALILCLLHWPQLWAKLWVVRRKASPHPPGPLESVAPK